MQIVCVIPARLHSTRFPKKILASLCGKPLLQCVYEAAKSVSIFDQVLIAIDDEETEEAVCAFGGNYFFTSKHCLSGTDRIVELLTSGKIEGSLFVNWQADEPFITESMIRTLLKEGGGTDVWTLKKKLHNPTPPNHVKVVTDLLGNALYFSRSPIPYGEGPHFLHIGLYGYTKEALLRIAKMEPSPLEKIEKLEQLRWLEHGLRIKVHETNEKTIGIDLPEHIALAEKHYQKMHPASYA